MKIVDAIINHVKSVTDIVPDAAIIVTSGFKNIQKKIEDAVTIKLSDIKGLPLISKDQKNKLVFGKMAGKNVVVMVGRMHSYFDYAPDEYASLIFAMKEMGCRGLITCTGVGAVDRKYNVGDIFIANDYINFSGDSALDGLNEDTYGNKYFDISTPYCVDCIAKAKMVAKKLGYKVREGVLAEFRGPQSETAAEVRMAHLMGASAIGSHIINETVLARYCGLRVMTINLITNYASGISMSKIKYEDIHYNLDVSTDYFSEYIEEVLKVL